MEALFVPAVLAGWAVAVAMLPGPHDPLVGWLSLAAAAAGLVSFAGHFADALSLRHRYPPLVLGGGAACVLLSGLCLWREPSGVLLARLGLPLVLTGLVWFYTLYFSVLHGDQRVSRLRVGDRFPDFALPDSDGRVVTRDSAVAQGPALLLFYKGDWWPFCVVQLGELRDYYAEFQRAGVGVYAVSVDPPGQNARLRARLGAGYEFLSDERGELLDALDIRQARRSVTGKDTAIPTQYLLDRGGVVRWVYRAGTWRVRPHPREALAAIRGLRVGETAPAPGAAAAGSAEPAAAPDRGG